MRLRGGPFSLHFGLPQLEPHPANPLVHLVSHGGTPSTSITPAANTVLPGATVTFSWSYTAGGTSGTDVAYKYTSKELDGSTGLFGHDHCMGEPHMVPHPWLLMLSTVYAIDYRWPNL